MRFILENTKSFWQLLAEDTLKRVVATVIAEGVKNVAEVQKEIYKSRQIRKENELIRQEEALKELRTSAAIREREEAEAKAKPKMPTRSRPPKSCKCNCECKKNEDS
jgi:hypothetical protein